MLEDRPIFSFLARPTMRLPRIAGIDLLPRSAHRARSGLPHTCGSTRLFSRFPFLNSVYPHARIDSAVWRCLCWEVYPHARIDSWRKKDEDGHKFTACEDRPVAALILTTVLMFTRMRGSTVEKEVKAMDLIVYPHAAEDRPHIYQGRLFEGGLPHGIDLCTDCYEDHYCLPACADRPQFTGIPAWLYKFTASRGSTLFGCQGTEVWVVTPHAGSTQEPIL